jgi:hypothetical protein
MSGVEKQTEIQSLTVEDKENMRAFLKQMFPNNPSMVDQ